jgi:putative transcriptional regulator
MLRAKRAVELLVDQGEVGVRLPNVQHIADLVRELKQAGIATKRIVRGSPGELGNILRHMRSKLDMTQEQFALRFGFDLDALQNWEQGRRTPDRAILSYLRVIARDPGAAARAQEEEEPA